jgi:EmrB/QacA subfamily drug resistance transporter
MKNKLLFIFGLSSFLMPFIASSINLALPLIGRDFGMNIVSLGWVATAFLLSTAIFVVPFGRLADIIGRKKIFITGAIIFSLTTFLCSFANSATFLLTARVLQGLGSAMIFATSMAIVVSVFPSHERGQALGINAAGVYLGSSMGPVFGGMITQYLGWRHVFSVTALLGLVVIGLALKYLNGEWKSADGEPFDLIGSILYGCAVTAMLYGTTMLYCPTGYVIMLSGLILFIIFCIVEDLKEHPIFHIDLLLKNRQFAMSNLAALINFCAAFGGPFFMSLYLQYAKGMQPDKAGFVLLTSAATLILGSPIAGRLADKRNARIISLIGMALVAVATLFLGVFINEKMSLFLIVLLLFIFGLGMSLFSTPNTNVAMSSVLPKHIGMASALLSTMRLFGQTLGIGISMLILSLSVGATKVSHANLHQFVSGARITYLVFAALSVIGFFILMLKARKGETRA